MKSDIHIGGLMPLTTIDFPGRLAAVVFCQGCPWRCGYCHNPELQVRACETGLRWADTLKFLHRRQGLLDGVVFSGGEPTLQSGLVDAVRAVKAMGYQVGLHTAGPYPNRLARLLPWLDWVGMDVKMPFERYESVTGVPGSGARALASARRVLNSGIAYEFRTTVDCGLLQGDTLWTLARSLAKLGVRNYVLQECRNNSSKVSQQIIPDPLTAKISLLFECFSLRRH